jgi:hypothetical protein
VAGGDRGRAGQAGRARGWGAARLKQALPLAFAGSAIGFRGARLAAGAGRGGLDRVGRCEATAITLREMMAPRVFAEGRGEAPGGADQVVRERTRLSVIGGAGQPGGVGGKRS